jgi:hypothetical protein
MHTANLLLSCVGCAVILQCPRQVELSLEAVDSGADELGSHIPAGRMQARPRWGVAVTTSAWGCVNNRTLQWQCLLAE